MKGILGRKIGMTQVFTKSNQMLLHKLRLKKTTVMKPFN